MPARKRKVEARIDWKSYEGDRVILPVCVRSQAVRSKEFEATVQKLSERVRQVHVIMCDTLDRYNVPEAETLRLSAEWQKAKLPVLEHHIPDYDVHVWNEVRAASSFGERLEAMQKLYETDGRARDIVDRIADHYLTAKARRNADKGLPFDAGRERANSTSYLIEEFAGTAEYASWYPGLPEAYWGVYVGNSCAFGDERLVLPVTLPVSIKGLPEPVAG